METDKFIFIWILRHCRNRIFRMRDHTGSPIRPGSKPFNGSDRFFIRCRYFCDGKRTDVIFQNVYGRKKIIRWFLFQLFGHISGSHINPCLSLTAVILGNMSFCLFFLYSIAQCLGATFGYALTRVNVSFWVLINKNTHFKRTFYRVYCHPKRVIRLPTPTTMCFTVKDVVLYQIRS